MRAFVNCRRGQRNIGSDDEIFWREQFNDALVCNIEPTWHLYQAQV